MSSHSNRSDRSNRSDHIGLGAEGEAHAAAYLERRGYRILGRNVREGGVEIDIIARRGRTLVFIEVKTRRGGRYGPPHEAVDARKRARIVRGALAWLRARGRTGDRIRFDVIAVERRSPRDWTIQHLEAAFDAGD